DQGTVHGISGPVDLNIADPIFFDHAIRTLARINLDKTPAQGTFTDGVSTPSASKERMPQSFDTQRVQPNDSQVPPSTTDENVQNASIPETLSIAPVLPSIPQEKNNSQEQETQQPLNNEKRFFFGSWCRKFFGRLLRWIKDFFALVRG
ncbi:MAG: hypothetical protein RBR24_07015, partial [Candidatus Carbobacillus sp.]|nr:hypothetical protein [Candidatus Carbobacillus sp.]